MQENVIMGFNEILVQIWDVIGHYFKIWNLWDKWEH